MNISKDGRTLYFSDEEIDNNINGEKKVFVTKRINGKESHIKAERGKKINTKQEKRSQEETFDFNNEIVIGVNVVKKQEEKKKQKNKKKRRKQPNKRNKTIETRKENHLNPFPKEKKKKINKKIVTFFSSILLMVIVGILALTAPIFNITDIQIQGNQKVDSNTILTLSGLKKGENIFKFNKSMIQNIKENTYIESVEISRKLPGTIFISVEERKITYQMSLINSYVYLDKNGYLLENSTNKQEVPVLVRFGNK